MAEPQEQDGQLLLGVGSDDDHGAPGRAHLVDGGAGQPQCHLGGQAVAELGIDVVGADDALGQLRPGVGILVGEPGPADHPDRRRSVGVDGGAQCTRCRPHRLAPAGGAEFAAVAHEGLTQPVGGVDGLEGEPALVAQPAPVHRVGVDADVADELVAR